MFSSLQECHSMGLDVGTWIRKETVDYIAPQDIMYADFNVAYEEFAELARSADCMLYPGHGRASGPVVVSNRSQSPMLPSVRSPRTCMEAGPTAFRFTTTSSTCMEALIGETPTFHFIRSPCSMLANSGTPPRSCGVGDIIYLMLPSEDIADSVSTAPPPARSRRRGSFSIEPYVVVAGLTDLRYASI